MLRSSSSLLRYYASENNSTRTRLLENSLGYVHTYGWTERAIHAGCVSLDLSPASHRLITPYDLVKHCMKLWSVAALRKIDDNNFNQQKRVRAKIAFAIKVRLEEELPWIDTWHQAMALGAHPSNLADTSMLYLK